MIKGGILQWEPLYCYKQDGWRKLLKEIKIELSNGKIATIPEGFITDCSSVPWRLGGILPKFGHHNLAAVIHDFLYIHKELGLMNKVESDKEMLLWSNALNGDKKNDSWFRYYERRLDNYTRYVLCRIIGGKVWKGKYKLNRALKEL